MEIKVNFQAPSGQVGGWCSVALPASGSAVLYPDGLLNVLDANGRCLQSHHDVESITRQAEEPRRLVKTLVDGVEPGFAIGRLGPATRAGSWFEVPLSEGERMTSGGLARYPEASEV